MSTYDSRFDSMPKIGKINVLWALMSHKVRENHAWTDWDMSNQASNHRRNARSKNAKAKHRKKYNR